MGLHILQPCVFYGDRFEWRKEAYEFVADRLAIDLLFGCSDARVLIDSGASVDDLDSLWREWQKEAAQFELQRAPYLRYS